ncbi:MAG: hypothetical protein EXQ78_05065 [Candidatus Planktophila sp.]|nr:hypothetical protein [Candidatus Planktophila sp.]
MESLVKFVVFMVLTSVTTGPLAIALTLIADKNLPLKVLRRILHGVLAMASLFFALIFSINPEMPPAMNLIGLFAFIMAYIALRREYFPDVRIIAPLLAKFGVKLWKKQKRSGNEQGSSHFGPVVKWRRGGHSGGNDGHGPEGQH